MNTMLRFAGVGLVTTLLDLALFGGLVAAGTMPGLANLISYSCGIALSYSLNSRWTFESPSSRRKAAKFVVSTLAGLAISMALLAAFSTVLAPVAAKIATVPLVFLWNFGAARLWVFPRGSDTLPPPG
ncbi:GtrA family protein [Aureimonas sp. SA4125]|uniref:GtrA family protein n=1 Tax=Aureimonas sp. SA4125 TaxID=2826993 RepID=UPI001CC566AC|nr:GtrA family protein [Aureimonas sp. SA4125]